MSTEVTLPALGESVTEGTISRWLKAVGDTVAVDEPLVEISTDKVDTEIPSPAAGTVLELRFEEDDVAEVGAVLAVIGDESEGGADAAPKAEPEESPAETEQESAPAPDESADDAAATQDDAPAQPAEDAKPAASSGPADGTDVTLPALGESVTEGTVSRWLKAVGEFVEADEPLLEVSTDKVDTEIPSPVSGTLLEVRVAEDEVAQVGDVLGVVGEATASAGDDAGNQSAGEDQSDADNDSAELTAQNEAEPEESIAPQADDAEAKQEAQEQSDQVTSTEGDKSDQATIPTESKPEPQPRPSAPSPDHSPAVAAAVARRAAEADPDAAYVTPLVRKMAKDKGVDLADVKGTGVGGRIRKQDVLDAAEAAKKAAEKPAEAPAASKPEPKSDDKPKAAPADNVRGKTEKLSRLRATIAKRMVESLQVAAQLTATVEVDVTSISRIRAQAKDDFKKREGASLSYLPFITMATVEALKQFPVVNATIDTDAGTVTYPDAEHIGIAVDTEKGLLVPVIKDAGDLNLAGLAKKIGDLAARTRASKVTPDELSGGTFTITNYGSAGTLFDTPIINQPQAAILGTGALVKRPVVVSDRFGGETIAIRDMMYLSISYDHRLIDGAVAARFLTAIKDRLEEGDFGSELGL